MATAPLATLGGNVHYDYLDVFYKVGIAFVVFCMAASSIYPINDVRDVRADRRHPIKRFRPIAAGVVGPIHLMHQGRYIDTFELRPEKYRDSALYAVYRIIGTQEHGEIPYGTT